MLSLIRKCMKRETSRDYHKARFINYTERLKELLKRLNTRLTEEQINEAISRRIKLNPTLYLEHRDLGVGKLSYSANMAKKYLTEVRERIKKRELKHK